MSQNNKIDFIPKTESYIPHFCRPTEDNVVEQGVSQISIISETLRKLTHNFNGFIVGFVTFSYLRINGTVSDNKLCIPANASLETLAFSENKNFFIEIFNRYKIICEANAVLGDTYSILEPYFVVGTENLTTEFQKEIAKELLQLDWSESGFEIWDCSYYVKDILIWENIVYDDNNTVYQGFYKELYHLTPLLNIQPNEKQLCTSILYTTYLANIFEQLDWPKHCDDNIVKYLQNVNAVQTNSVLWAIHTIEAVLLGCNKQVISNVTELSEIHNEAGNGFDVIFLPEVDYETTPDVGPISIGNTVINKNDYLFYSVSFLYNLLNDHGRMFVRFSGYAEEALSRDPYDLNQADGLLAYFVDNNLIETMIQIKNCTYMLIDKNRPKTKHGRILFYYIQDLNYIPECYFPENEKLASCIKEYTCENTPIKHDEGACLVTNEEIRLNNYCLLPKKYIYDFDRITAIAEFQVVRHLAHNLTPKLDYIDSVLKPLIHFIESHELSQESLQEQYYEGQPFEPVGEAIAKASINISQMHKLIKDTRKLITEDIPLEEFRSVNLRDFLEAIKQKYINKNFILECFVHYFGDVCFEMHETSFAEMIDNFIRNAEIHGFTCESIQPHSIFIFILKSNNDKDWIINIMNNGVPLPNELTAEKFIDFGSKGKSSPGDGLGGAYIYKVIRAHRGNLEIIRDNKEFPVNFRITLPIPEVNK